ncbi:type I-E CRISPR-associated protein Cse2/CasB [Corynebacterium kozikiae]|uniref:type I-E CRISPR-associated protein Cse2/CasB n=1 Tax=Corynebacterium kozikiae TaxID=2968469 RepID=UPI00211B8060|nr:type I-E CRISPR-associated protein Cse2/CasB [Corynebacterium sp. 76QC2CO]MCQ9342968.1 type I-E CRISPR-associated protein Cse2/CasB [Corynebacterium sp. 76QC2CO]
METNDPREFAPLKDCVSQTCARLQRDYFSPFDTPAKHAARGTLANFRRNIGVPLRANPLLLEEVLLELDPKLDPPKLGYSDTPTPTEIAATTALQFFALHMQSATKPMHEPMQSFAEACGRLHATADSKSIKPRLDAMMLANSETNRLIHLRSIITLLRSKDLGFNYGWFALDLERLQDPKQRPGVQLRWGRDIVRGAYYSSKKENVSES